MLTKRQEIVAYILFIMPTFILFGKGVFKIQAIPCAIGTFFFALKYVSYLSDLNKLKARGILYKRFGYSIDAFGFVTILLLIIASAEISTELSKLGMVLFLSSIVTAALFFYFYRREIIISSEYVYLGGLLRERHELKVKDDTKEICFTLENICVRIKKDRESFLKTLVE
ncbi:MAG: hypothetical protein ACYC1H_11880 [Rectinema subterraneum]|jgi:hypothetical protein